MAEEEYDLSEFDFQELTTTERLKMMREGQERLLQENYNLNNRYVVLQRQNQELRALVREQEAERDRLTEKLSSKRDKPEENHRFDLDFD